jgi:hypothetical protein
VFNVAQVFIVIHMCSILAPFRVIHMCSILAPYAPCVSFIWLKYLGCTKPFVWLKYLGCFLLILFLFSRFPFSRSHAMDCRSCESFTIEVDSLRFLNNCFIDTTTHVLYWNAISVQQQLREKAAYSVKLYKLVKHVGDVSIANGVGESNVIPKPKRADSGGRVDAHLVGTDSLVAWISANPGINQSPRAVKDLCRRWLGTMCEKALIAHSRLSSEGYLIRINTVDVTVSVGGEVTGWTGLLAKCPAVISVLWGADEDSNGLASMLHFATRHAHIQGANLLKVFSVKMIHSFVAPNFDMWVVNVYAVEHRLDRLWMYVCRRCTLV